MKPILNKILSGLWLIAWASLTHAASTASWIYQAPQSSTVFADSLKNAPVSQHVFAADTPGYSMKLSGYSNTGSPIKLGAAHTIDQWGVGLASQLDNAIHHGQYLMISDLTVPSDQKATGLQLVIYSFEPGVIANIYGSSCITFGCQLTQITSVKYNEVTRKTLVNLNALDLSTYRSFWITAQDDNNTSGVMLGNGTQITSKNTTVSLPVAIWIFCAAFAGLMSFKKKKAA